MNKLPFLIIVLCIFALGGCSQKIEKEMTRPNFLIIMSDNQCWNHLGCYGDQVVKTPNIDAVAEKGVLFTNAYCSAPSCTPARASMLTGQDIWRLEEGANLWGVLPAKHEVYPDIMEREGYYVGYSGKGWGPGKIGSTGRTRNPGGDKYKSLNDFLSKQQGEEPFMFWFNSWNPHRPYKEDLSGTGIDLSKIEVPAYLPDCDEVRQDIAGYYAEIQDFDKQVGMCLKLLQEKGELENTIVIVASDNGWQMPRGLANLYDAGTRVPMIISMPERFKGNRVVDDFVYLTDLAPTFLDFANIEIPESMTAKSLANILESDKSGQIEAERDFVVTARERHAYVRKNGAGYGSRAIRTKDYLYIKNYDSNNWPVGDPPLYGDLDPTMFHYACPTKFFLVKNKDKQAVKPFFDLTFSKRPEEELYDLGKDPDQTVNVASLPAYQAIKKEIASKMEKYQEDTKDPRVVGGVMKWENAIYYQDRDKKPQPSEWAIEELGLEKEYNYDE